MSTDAPEPLDKQHPFEPFPGTDASCFIQWKGTDVCIDVHCPCGHHGHFDGDFAYFVECPACGAVYQLGTQVKLVKTDDHYDPKMLDLDQDAIPGDVIAGEVVAKEIAP